MNKSLILSASALCLFGLNSCFVQEDDIWPQSAEERISAQIETYHELLSSAPNGWVLQYFANENETGYPLLMRFDELPTESGSLTHAGSGVLMAALNSVSSGGSYQEEASTYELISDQSIVLTFNTYNSLLHTFASPADNNMGHNGDYEFVLERVSENTDTIYLHGKKHSISMRLIKLPEDVAWSDYYNQLTLVQQSVYDTRVPEYRLVADGVEYSLTGLDQGIFVTLPEGGDAALQTESRGMVMTLGGQITLSSPFTGVDRNLNALHFEKAEDGTCIICTDEGQDVRIYAYDALTTFRMEGTEWHIDATKDENGNYLYLTGNFATLYDKVVSDVPQAIGREFDYFGFTYNAVSSRYTIIENNGRALASFYVDHEVTDDSIRFVWEENEGDNNAILDLQRIPSIGDFVRYICSSAYTLSVEDVLKPSRITFTSVTNPSDSFVVVIQ